MYFSKKSGLGTVLMIRRMPTCASMFCINSVSCFETLTALGMTATISSGLPSFIRTPPCIVQPAASSNCFAPSGL